MLCLSQVLRADISNEVCDLKVWGRLRGFGETCKKSRFFLDSGMKCVRLTQDIEDTQSWWWILFQLFFVANTLPLGLVLWTKQVDIPQSRKIYSRYTNPGE